MKTIDVPGVGAVDFPEEMSDEDIVTAIEKEILPQVEAQAAARQAAEHTWSGRSDGGDEPGYLSNLARGVGERALDLVGGGLRTVGTLAEAGGDWLERKIPLSGMTEEQIQQTNQPLTGWADSLSKVDLGYEPGTTWQDVKDNWANAVPFAIEQGVVSIPDMAAVMLAPAPYLAGRTGEIAQTRAENDGRESATVEDLIKAAPAAAASALLERYSTRGMMGLGDDAVRAANQLPAAMGRAAVREGATEFAQESSDYLGEQLGTQRGATLAEGLERGVAGMVAGAPFGGGVKGLTGTIQIWAQSRGVEPTQENLEAAAAQGDTQAMDILRASGLMSDEQLAALSPEAAERFAKRYQDRLKADQDPVLAAQRTQEARDRADLEGGDPLPEEKRKYVDKNADYGGPKREDILKAAEIATQQVDAAIEAGTIKPKERDLAISERIVGLIPELDRRQEVDPDELTMMRVRLDQIRRAPPEEHTPELADEFIRLRTILSRSKPARVIPLGQRHPDVAGTPYTGVDGKAVTGYTDDPGLAQAVNLRGRPNLPVPLQPKYSPHSPEEIAHQQALMRRQGRVVNPGVEPDPASVAPDVAVPPPIRTEPPTPVIRDAEGFPVQPKTPQEAAQLQIQAENRATGVNRLYGSEDRLVQTPADVTEQRKAGQAMRLAKYRASKAREGIRDVRGGGRPIGGVDSQMPVWLHQGRPVERLAERTVPNSRGEPVTKVTVRRYDPRTGQPAFDPELGEAVEYEVFEAELDKSKYAVAPRRSQLFEEAPGALVGKVEAYKVEPHKNARGETVTSDAVGRKVKPEAVGKRIDEMQDLPRQTYRTTAPDPTVPGAEGPTTELPGQGPVPRSPRPDQGEGLDVDAKSGGKGPFSRGDQTTAEANARARAAAAAEAERKRRERQWDQGQRGQTRDEKTGEQTDFGKARSRYEGQDGIYSGKPKGVDEDGWPLTDEDGYILSDKGGPIRFSPDDKDGDTGTKAMRKRLIELRRAHPEAMIVNTAHPGPMKPDKLGGVKAYHTLQAMNPKPPKVEPEQEQTAAPETPGTSPSVPAVAPNEYPGFTERKVRDGSGREPGRRGATREAPFTAPENFAAWQARRDQDVRDLEEASAAEAPSPYGMRERNVRDASGKESPRRGAERGAPFSQERDGNVTSGFRQVNAEQLVASVEKGLRDRQVKPSPKAVARYYEVSEEDAAKALATIAGRSNKIIRQVKPSKKELAAALKPKEGAEAPAPKGPRYRLTPQFDEDMSLLEFLMSKGGLAANGDLTAMDAHRKSHPRYGNLVRKQGGGGLTLDEARELAEGEGYIGSGDDYQTSDIQDLLDAIEDELRGNRVTTERAGSGTEREQMEARARELGIEVNPDWVDAELMVEIGEAEAIANEDNPTVEAADALREVVDAMLVELGIFPDTYRADFDIPFGDERAGFDQGAREVGTAPEVDAAPAPESAAGEAGTVRSGDRAATPRTGDAQEAGGTGRQTPAIERTDQGDQYVLVGQASSRDGKKTGKGPQRRADEGLFAEEQEGPDPRQIDLEEAIAAAKVDETPTLTDRMLAVAKAYDELGDTTRAAGARAGATAVDLKEVEVAQWEKGLASRSKPKEPAEPETPAKGTQREVDGVIVVATGNPDRPWAGGRYVEKGTSAGWQPDTSLGFGDTPEAAATEVQANRRRADADQKKRAEADKQLEAAVERAKRGETLDAATLKAISRYGDGKATTTQAKSFLIGMGLNTKQADKVVEQVGSSEQTSGGAWLYDLGRVIRAGQNVLDVAKVVEKTAPAPKAEAAPKPLGVAAAVNQARKADIAGNPTELEREIYRLYQEVERRKGRKEYLAEKARVAKAHWKSGPHDLRMLGGLSQTARDLDNTRIERDKNMEEIKKGEAKLKELAAKLPRNPPKRKERAALLSRLFGRDPNVELTAEMEAADDAVWRERLEQIAPRAETVEDIRRILDENVERGVLDKATAKGISDILSRIPTEGLKGIRLVIQDRMTAEEREILGTRKGALGEYITFDDDPDTRVMVVQARQGSRSAVDTFVHENAHVLFDRISDADKAAARRIYDSLPISRQALHTVDYGKDERFEEWFSESMVDYYNDGLATAGPRGSFSHQLGGLAQRLYKRIVDLFSGEKAKIDAFFSGLERSLGYSGPVSVDGITRRERRGVSTLAILSNPIGAVTGDWKAWKAGYQELRRDVTEAWKSPRPNRQSAAGGLARWFFYSADGEYRAAIGKFNSPTLNFLADTFHAKAGGRHGLDRKLATKLGMKLDNNATFDESVTRKINAELRQLSRILDPFQGDQAALDRIVDLVQKPASRRSDPESKAASEIAKLLRDMHRYMKDAGVDVGEIKNGYFPRETDVAAVLKNPTGFVEKATKEYRASGLSAEKAKEAADNWLTNILYGGEGSPVRKSSGTTPSFVQSRVLTKQADETLKEFYQRDPRMILGSYISRAVKRAEIAKRFGDNWKNWENIEKQIRAEDPAAAGMLDLAREYAATAAGVRQDNVSGLIRQGSSVVRTLTSVSLLEKSTLTSLGEAVMPAIRTGSLLDLIPALTKTLTEFRRELAHMPPSVAADLAADIGAIAGSGVNSLMAARFAGGDPLGRGQARVLAAYFRRIGLEQWTNATRVAATERGAVFIRRLAHDIAGNGWSPKASRIYMEEMGVPAAQIDRFVAYVNGFGNDLPAASDLDKGGEMGAAYRVALLRFVDTTVMRPTTTTRPRWASHPVGAVLFQLQAFSYAFSKNVVLRNLQLAKTAATRSADLDALDRLTLAYPVIMMLPLLAVTQLAVGELRDWLFMDPERRAAQTPAATFEKAISRAGLLGGLDPYIQMISQARYQKDPISALTGPFFGVLGSGLMAVQQYIGNNTPNTNAAERKATEALYDVILEPMVNIALGYSPASPLSTLFTMGLIPGLRDEFVDSVAGPRIGHTQQKIYGATEILTGKPFEAKADSWAARG